MPGDFPQEGSDPLVAPVLAGHCHARRARPLDHPLITAAPAVPRPSREQVVVNFDKRLMTEEHLELTSRAGFERSWHESEFTDTENCINQTLGRRCQRPACGLNGSPNSRDRTEHRNHNLHVI